jgi:hypothetical protein
VLVLVTVLPVGGEVVSTDSPPVDVDARANVEVSPKPKPALVGAVVRVGAVDVMGAVEMVDVVTEAPVFVANNNTGGALTVVGAGINVLAMIGAAVAVTVAVEVTVVAVGAGS